MIDNNRNIIMYGSQSLTSNRFLAKEQRGDGEFTKRVQSLPNLRREGSSVVDSRVDEKVHQIIVGVLSDQYKSTSQLLEELGNSISKNNRFLHIVRDWKTIATVGTDQGWSFEDDAVAVEFDPEEYIFTGSMKLSVVVSASAYHRATLTNNTGEGVDLSEYIGEGDFEFGVYLPDPSYVAYVEIKVGSDSSNYLESDLFQQYDDEPISRGWNWFSVAWNQMLETGNTDANLMGRFISISIYYTSDQADEDGFRISEIIWQNDQNTRNFRSYVMGIPTAQRLASMDEITLMFKCPSGVAEETTPTNFVVQNGISNIVQNLTFSTGGSYAPDPLINIELHTVTSLDKIIVTNQLTNDSVTLDATWAVNDKILMNTATGVVKVNNAEIAYSDVLPTFGVGYNSMSISIVSDSEESASQTTQNSTLSGEI